MTQLLEQIKESKIEKEDPALLKEKLEAFWWLSKDYQEQLLKDQETLIDHIITLDKEIDEYREIENLWDSD